uniref:Uncharacterized protein n=1 Tax=Attheya septentrionalis TaxID=420275 RepID=A0A7S2XX67_9STRA|mmetsp:Transcript_9200/g.16688  ORF Transcript_9200/g.16688 Transcript_9200/m.16688 type:complete len:388 (+) Transcript_9200:251-1414(+)|eukprot:CAMPEP_0198297422 /NCGR_PEP_ID=MMETSP1449-20131203/36804_1 /TAXON_ID=420275 /ORGANISM="Attheya septentrionalis, Strain CCMP2084" /LENGTH=387 /DNA_ID=CAMNT_0043998341 /DNA_START=187 /DNA_END=1350 /DNA_ORIENTATION=+
MTSFIASECLERTDDPRLYTDLLTWGVWLFFLSLEVAAAIILLFWAKARTKYLLGVSLTEEEYPPGVRQSVQVTDEHLPVRFQQSLGMGPTSINYALISADDQKNCLGQLDNLKLVTSILLPFIAFLLNTPQVETKECRVFAGGIIASIIILLLSGLSVIQEKMRHDSAMFPLRLSSILYHEQRQLFGELSQRDPPCCNFLKGGESVDTTNAIIAEKKKFTLALTMHVAYLVSSIIIVVVVSGINDKVIPYVSIVAALLNALLSAVGGSGGVSAINVPEEVQNLVDCLQFAAYRRSVLLHILRASVHASLGDAQSYRKVLHEDLEIVPDPIIRQPSRFSLLPEESGTPETLESSEKVPPSEVKMIETKPTKTGSGKIHYSLSSDLEA